MTEEYKKRKAEYIRKYQKENYKLVVVKCRKVEDQEILDTLKASGNASEFCKRAIRYYIENGGK